LTLAVKAKVVVELGTGVGYSTDAFLTALRLTDGILYSVDINLGEPIKGTIERLKGETRVVFILGDSREVGKNWDKGNIDLLLCDSDHHPLHVLAELEIWGKFNPKLILIHDTLNSDGQWGHLYKIVKEYTESKGRIFYNLDIPYGLGVIA